MKVTVTKRHIQAGKLNGGSLSPVELAIIDLDCFEEISLTLEDSGTYVLIIDGTPFTLQTKVQNALSQFEETQEMKPFNFDLPLDNSLLLGGDDMLFESFDDSFSYGYA